MRPSLRGLLALAVACAACAKPPEVPPPVTITDSAGVTIVTSIDPEWGDTAQWVVDSEPMLQLGGADDDTDREAFLQDIAAVRLLASGSLLTLLGEDLSVRWYNMSGREERRVGRAGEGPGEYRSLRFVGFLADSIVIWDRRLERATVLDSAGRVGRIIRLEVDPALSWRGYGFNLHGTLSDRRLLLVSQTATSSTESTGLRRDTLPIGLAHPDGRFDRLVARLPGNEWQVINLGNLFTGNERPFGAKTHIRADGATIVASIGDRPGVERWTATGSLVASYRLERPRRTLTAEDAETHRGQFPSQEVIEADPTWGPLIQAERDVPLPSHFAEHDRLLIDGVGAIWLRRDVGPYAGPKAPGAWTILDQTGRWLGEVTTPPGFEVHDITTDRLVGVWKDEADLEYIRVYRLNR